MQEDKDSLTTISKWPFYLGDLLLVAAGVAIVALGNEALSNWQVASCVMSVALGAGLFVLPHIVEYQVRIREERSDRRADLRALRRKVEGLEEQLDEVLMPVGDLEPRIRLIAQTNDLISGAVDQMSERLDTLESADSGESLKALEGRLTTLDEDLRTAQQGLAAMDEQKAAIEHLKEAINQPQPQPEAKDWSPEIDALKADLEKQIAELQATLASLITNAVEASAEPRPARKRHKPEPRLLHRAMSDHSAVQSSAVSRIIKSKSKAAVDDEPKEAEAAAVVESPEEERVVPEPLDVADLEEPVAEESVAVQTGEPEPEPSVEPIVEIKEEPEVAEVDETPEVTVEVETTEPVLPEPIQTSVDSESEPPAQSDLFGGAAPVAVPTRSRVKKKDTVVTAEIFIGIGNKPYLRGAGPGLSWEKGVVMDFEEIGKWRWVAPVDADEAFEVQVFRNDEDPDRKGTFSVEPGTKLVLEPKFD